MAGLVNAEAAAALDFLFPTTGASDFIGYSSNGTSENTSIIPSRTAIGATGWAAATVADPSIKANSGLLTAATAAAAGSISHFAVFTESTGGALRTDWQALDTPRTFAIGDIPQWAAGALKVSLT